MSCKECKLTDDQRAMLAFLSILKIESDGERRDWEIKFVDGKYHVRIAPICRKYSASEDPYEAIYDAMRNAGLMRSDDE